jgi:hypothetical protein
VCAGHAAVRDESETEIDGAVSFENGGNPERQPLIMVITGPDRDGEFGLLAADCVYMTRFVAEDLIRELQARLDKREQA